MLLAVTTVTLKNCRLAFIRAAQKVANGMQKRVHCAMHFEFLIAENRDYPRETCNLPDRGSASFQKMLYQNRNIVVT